MGIETPLPRKVCTKFLGLPSCCTVEHVQLKNVTVDAMNTIVAITVGVKCAQSAPKCTILKEKIQKKFLGSQTYPHWGWVTFGASILVSSALEPPFPLKHFWLRA